MIWVVGYFAVYTGKITLQKSIGESSISLAKEILTEIDRDIHSRIVSFQAYSKNHLLQTTVSESNQKFEAMDNRQKYIDTKDQEWTSAPKKMITPFMAESINNKLSEELRDKLNFFDQKYGYPVFGEVFLTNRFGANVAQTGKTSDYKQNDESWWQLAKQNGISVENVEYDDSAEVNSIAIGIRIDDQNQNFIGVMKIVYSMRGIEETVHKAISSMKYITAQARLIDHNGRILLDSAGEYPLFQDISNQDFFTKIVGNEGFSIKKHDHDHETGEYDTELFSYARSTGFSDYPGLGWIFMLEYDSDEILAPVVKLKKNILILTLIAAALTTLLGYFLTQSITRPLKNLKNITIEIGQGNLDAAIDIHSNDEIGQLAESFRKMTNNLKHSTASIEELKEARKELEKAHKKMLDTSFMAGKAEVASNVLHNVKNVLNSLNISACLITESITNSQLINLKKTMDLINAHSENLGEFLTTDEKGKHIPLYLNKLSDALTHEQNDLLEDMHQLAKNVDHLKEIINTQQSYAKVMALETHDSLEELVADALKINQEALEHHGVKVKKDFAELSEVTLDKQKTLQILVNLISNATNAMKTCNTDDRWITIRCDTQQDILRIEVADNGIGILQENMTKIFSHGFTTKKDGHGFGLHSAALAAEEMKGSLNAHSDGPGKGATFTLEIPYKPAGQNHEQLHS
ncbi:MAG: sensor histidine kinase [Planctomycetes bacterium]|nr:sensor histidine kinase [Planctomycetota bacterium]